MQLPAARSKPILSNKNAGFLRTTARFLLGIVCVAVVLIALSPSIMKVDPPTVAAAARHLIQRAPIFPLENPGILSIPLGFLGAILGTFLRPEPEAESRYAELIVRANTGLGAEEATVE